MRSGEHYGHVGSKKANASQQETGMAAFIDGLKNMLMRGLNGRTSMSLMGLLVFATTSLLRNFIRILSFET